MGGRAVRCAVIKVGTGWRRPRARPGGTRGSGGVVRTVCTTVGILALECMPVCAFVILTLIFVIQIHPLE